MKKLILLVSILAFTLSAQSQMIIGAGVTQKTMEVEGTIYTKSSPLIFTSAAVYGGWNLLDMYQIKIGAVSDMNLKTVTGYGKYTSYRAYLGFGLLRATDLSLSPTMMFNISNLILDDYNKISYEYMMGLEFFMSRPFFDAGTWGIAIAYFDGLNMDNCLRTYEFHSTIYLNINF